MRFQRIAPITAFFWTVAVALFEVFGPSYRTASSTSSVDTITRGYKTGLEVNGSRVVFVVVIPVLLTIAPLLLQRRRVRIVSGGLLLIFCMVAAASIGLLFLPAALLLIVSGMAMQNAAS